MSPILYHSGRFPPQGLDWERLLPLIGPAHAAVAAYQGTLFGVPNTNVLLAPLASQEAVISNRIEGTITTLTEVLTFEAQGALADQSTPAAANAYEVLNYRVALFKAIELLDEIPLSQRLIRDAHKLLMQGVRGHDKAPGQYRTMPNSTWIGPEGSSIEDARFIPCAVEELPSAMSAWEFYIHKESPDSLVQLAILHAEFEAIHPFLDGNGRTGRLIVPLFMYTKGLLSYPHFYISEFLSDHQDEYYDRLLAVSRDDDWTGWCLFFLNAITKQARMNQARAQMILELYNARKDWIVAQTRSQYGGRALDWIFGKPIFQASDFVRLSGIPSATASRILRVLRESGMLHELREPSGRRAAILAFPDLLNVAEGREVF